MNTHSILRSSFVGKTMYTTYHLCISEEREVLFRNKEDFVRGINCLSLAAHDTKTRLLAYAFMSNHVHICISTDNIKKFTKAFWYPYTRYFNAKYHRKGHLGPSEFYTQKIEGLHHFLTAIAYILRNPMHHGITSTPFGYKYSSIKSVFKDDFGWNSEEELINPKYVYKHVSWLKKLPESFKMNKDGMILAESVIDVNDLEHQFSTARTFLYYMNRLSGEKWEAEQMQDGIDQKPITLETIEKVCSHQDIRTMLANEHGRSNYKTTSDLELCAEIDSLIRKELKKASIYVMTGSEKDLIKRRLSKKFFVPTRQLNRCLVIRDNNVGWI